MTPARWGVGGCGEGGGVRMTPLSAVKDIAGTQNNSRGGRQKRQLDESGNLESVK